VIKKRIHSLSMWCFENLLARSEMGHFITTRKGGHSDPPFGSLNLSFNVGDDPQKVLRNRQLLAETLGVSLGAFTAAKQIHDAQVKIVTSPLQGRGSMDHRSAIDGVDAMITRAPDVCLMILLADCVPIVLYDPARRAVGVVHAGWKGTLQFIAEKTVKTLEEAFDSSPQDMVAGIGPSIGPCCYEVGPEVVSQIKALFGADHDYVLRMSSGGRGYFDLWTANLRQLVQAGIPKENIEVAETCTCHHLGDFFSHRCERGKTGRFGVGVFIRSQASL
jgi:YfiH family protein